MKYLTQQDIDYLVNQSTDRINITLAGMTALMKDTDANIEAMESQSWYKRMLNTVLGKNKATKLEIQQNHDKLNAYMSEAIAALYDRQCIDEKIIPSLGLQINQIYAEQIQLKQILGAFVNKLNEKIESVDKFHLLCREIVQGVYQNENIISMFSIISQLDKRILQDERRLNVIKRDMSDNNLLPGKIKIFDLLLTILNLPPENIGTLYFETKSLDNSVIARAISSVIENYHFLSDIEKELTKKKTVIVDTLKKNDFKRCVRVTYSLIFDDLIDAKTQYLLIDSEQEEKTVVDEIFRIQDLAETLFGHDTSISCGYLSAPQIDKFVADKYADHTDIFLSAQTLEELEFKHYFSEKSAELLTDDDFIQGIAFDHIYNHYFDNQVKLLKGSVNNLPPTLTNRNDSTILKLNEILSEDTIKKKLAIVIANTFDDVQLLIGPLPGDGTKISKKLYDKLHNKINERINEAYHSEICKEILDLIYELN